MRKIIKADFEFSESAFVDFINIMIPEAIGKEFEAITIVENNEIIEIEISSENKKIVIKNRNYLTIVDEQKTVMFKTGIMKMYGKKPRWGSLIGVRPTKLLIKLLSKNVSIEVCREILKELYLVSNRKINLLEEVVNTEKKYMNKSGVNFYIGIPFCPTRCSYCSFASYEKKGKHGDIYNEFVKKLEKEIKIYWDYINNKKINIESIYMGGGTPTILEEKELEDVLKTIYNEIKDRQIKEFTVEAGRVDTITIRKLDIMKKYGVTRISLNPQTFNNKTFSKIGRICDWENFESFNKKAKELGFIVNMDLIVGLPDETTEDIIYSINKLEEYRPENFTIHMLAIKKGSKLNEDGYQYIEIDYDKIERCIESYAEKMDMKPYYMYRQKKSIDVGENRGYSIKGKESLFNIEMIEENQNTIGAGGGAITKIIDKSDIIRIVNPKDPIQYVLEFEERISKKLEILDKYYK
mgnify:CR=1 FL=1